ncbi:DUF1640 domain-containing protein [Lamprobacter modestohalophilus]|uniref:DUF1640 domain-containing protein n=1 Tax=Lamprobacter modestohalophilus TaxID=1064514 RepID=UPI002ADEF11F|nr:DUF1640 domain-containing protein [Lamprobacter modestohalophilus]MEA1052786.1 DUF1640 domain-containing protein [Lamprobacter modestohalophilus]
MGVAVKLYEQLAEAVDDQTRIRLLAEAIGQLERIWPSADEIPQRHDLRETELRLQKEIEIVRKEIEIVRGENKDMELRLQKEIEAVRKEIEIVRKEIKELELRLSKEIKQVELQVQEARIEIKATEASLRMAIHRQTLWVVGAVGTVVGLIRVLEWLLP